MRYRLQRHDGTDCSATMVPITVLRMVPIQRYRHSLLVETLLTTKVERVALNAAWILSHLRKEDKEIYLASSYDKLTDFAMQPHLTIRRGLVLPISLDISIGKNQDRYIEFLFEGNAQ